MISEALEDLILQNGTDFLHEQLPVLYETYPELVKVSYEAKAALFNLGNLFIAELLRDPNIKNLLEQDS